jgi:antitoxin component YwqK of YwqJK toxin-antitoxin module
LSKKDSDSKLPENVVEGWQNIEENKAAIINELNKNDKMMQEKFAKFNEDFTTKDLAKFQKDIDKFKNEQYETSKPDNKDLSYDIAMEKITAFNKEVEEFRKRENDFFKFGIELFNVKMEL